MTCPVAGPAHDHHRRTGCSTHRHGILHRHPARPGGHGRARVGPSRNIDTCRQDQHHRYNSSQTYYATSLPPAESRGAHYSTHTCSTTNARLHAGANERMAKALSVFTHLRWPPASSSLTARLDEVMHCGTTPNSTRARSVYYGRPFLRHCGRPRQLGEKQAACPYLEMAREPMTRGCSSA